MSKRLSIVGAIGALALATTGASAATILPGTYILGNHPDGNAAPPQYGLRLDGLLDGSAGSTYTFDFEHPMADMKLDYDGATIRIFGTAFGGLDTGGSYDAGLSGLIDVDFTYNMNVGTAPGDDDLLVTANMQNTGTVELVSGFSDYAGETVFDLVDKSNGDFSFRFGDKDDDNGHRGFAGISGWGWLNHAPSDGSFGNIQNHLKASDWLFTATPEEPGRPIPLPSAAGMGLAGLAVLGVRRRR